MSVYKNILILYILNSFNTTFLQYQWNCISRAFSLPLCSLSCAHRCSALIVPPPPSLLTVVTSKLTQMVLCWTHSTLAFFMFIFLIKSYNYVPSMLLSIRISICFKVSWQPWSKLLIDYNGLITSYGWTYLLVEALSKSIFVTCCLFRTLFHTVTVLNTVQ